jgi:hypothetical protein
MSEAQRPCIGNKAVLAESSSMLEFFNISLMSLWQVSKTL